MGDYADDAIHAGLDESWGWRRPRSSHDAALAAARCRAHAAFDPLWKEGSMSRSEAYKWLAEQLGMARDRCHIADFRQDICEQVVDICTKRAFADLATDAKPTR